MSKTTAPKSTATSPQDNAPTNKDNASKDSPHALTPQAQARQPEGILTRLQHVGTQPCDEAHPVAAVPLPPMRTSTVRFHDMATLEAVEAQRAAGARPMNYGRYGMDTHVALEALLCDLEQGERCFLSSSGMAAISHVLLALVNHGDHVLITDNVYGPVRQLDHAVLQRFGITTSYVNGHDRAALELALTSKTKVLYVESPGSLLMEMLDLPALSQWAKAHGLIVVADNTWGSGWIYRPLALGADVSVVAATKYLGGHSDLLMGAVVAKGEAVIASLSQAHNALGHSVSADDVWLALRGARTMPLRLQQHAINALAVCEYLDGWAQTQCIYYPAYAKDAHHAIWQRDALGSNGLLSVEIEASAEQARVLVDALRLFYIGYSWGGYESLVQWVQPSQLQGHRYASAAAQEGRTQVLRLHIGLESADDLIADLAQAHAKAFG